MLKIYIVDKKDYGQYTQQELDKMSQEVTEVAEVADNQVVVKAEFSKNGMDFSSVDDVVHLLLMEQYEKRSFIIQEDLNNINKVLDKIEKRDIETLDEILFAKRQKIKSINEIIEIIKNHKNYMLLYMKNEKELGEFIVRNIEDYKISIETLHNIEDYIDYKGIAEEYLYDNYIENICSVKSLILDISNDKENELVRKLQMKKIDARTIYDIKERNTNKKFEEVKNLKIENEEEME